MGTNRTVNFFVTGQGIQGDIPEGTDLEPTAEDDGLEDMLEGYDNIGGSDGGEKGFSDKANSDLGDNMGVMGDVNLLDDSNGDLNNI